MEVSKSDISVSLKVMSWAFKLLINECETPSFAQEGKIFHLCYEIKKMCELIIHLLEKEYEWLEGEHYHATKEIDLEEIWNRHNKEIKS